MQKQIKKILKSSTSAVTVRRTEFTKEFIVCYMNLIDSGFTQA